MIHVVTLAGNYICQSRKRDDIVESSHCNSYRIFQPPVDLHLVKTSTCLCCLPIVSFSQYLQNLVSQQLLQAFFTSVIMI